MLKKSNLFLIIGLLIFYSPSHAKEISKESENLSSTVEDITEEMVNLNSSLNSLSTTISNLVFKNNI